MSLVSVLISEDSEGIYCIRSIFQKVDDARLEVVYDLDEATHQWRRSDVNLGIVHLVSNENGRAVKRLLLDLKQSQSPIPLIVLCGPEIKPALTLDLLRTGAADCLRFPLEEGKLQFLIESLTLRSRIEFRVKTQSRSDGNMSVLSGGPASEIPEFLVGSSAMKKILTKVQRVADFDEAVLLTGETGTGKTRIARYLHEQSSRRSEPFVHLDCASIPESLFEGELFGHRRGAFTGADHDRKGRCNAASGGTLFIDEIDAVSLEVQSRLLRLTDERVYSPVGSTDDTPLKARVIVGTNRNLLDEVTAGRFRKDLYYRLNVLNLKMPSLTERREEIQMLAQHFMKQSALRHKMPVPMVDAAVWDAFQAYVWPGNVRELRNTVEQIMAFCSDPTITMEDLPQTFQDLSTVSARSEFSEQVLFDDMEEVVDSRANVTDSWIGRQFPEMNSLGIGRVSGEIRKIVEALVESENNRTLAARALGVSREALYKKLRKYDLMDFEIEANQF